MKSRMTFAFLLSALLFTPLVALSPAMAEDDPADESLPPNIRVTLTIGNSEAQSGFRERNYRTIARPRNETELMMGWRTPIPSKRKEVAEDGENPITAYTYQNVGVTGRFDLELLGEQILMRLQVEVSGPKGGAGEAVASDTPPIIGTFQQRLVVLLADGKPLRVAEVPDHDGGALYLEVTAEILD